MIGKYFNGVIEQVYHRIGQEEQNIVMACYGNSLTVSGLETVKRYSEEPDGVFFACTELEQDRIVSRFWISSVRCSEDMKQEVLKIFWKNVMYIIYRWAC